MGSSFLNALIKLVQIPVTILTALGLGGGLWPPQTMVKNNTSVDYIIIGMGTAGSVLTRRLVEDKQHTVLALEAGDNPPVLTLLPGLFPLFPHSPVDYDFKSTLDNYAARGQNNYTMLTAGKTIGGSATINHFIHTRGIKEDFDYWASVTKDKTWKYKNVLKYFIKSERVDDVETIKQYGKFHGTEGPMGITRELHDVDDYLQAFEELGYPTVLDLNANIGFGYTQPQLMIADGKRQTPGYSYMHPVKDNKNLFTSKNTQVDKILFDGNTAIGVKAYYKDKPYTFLAKKEVIVCAGVYNTPLVLMRSGIGNSDHLKTFNIKPLQDLPVGDSVVHQVSVTLVHTLEKHLLPFPPIGAILTDPTKIPFPVILGSVALNKSDTTSRKYQTFNLVLPHDSPYLSLACSTVFGFRDGLCDGWQKEAKFKDSFYSIVAYTQPESKGSVRMMSTNPFDKPIITTGFYKKDNDLQVMMEFVKDFIRIGNTTFFTKIGAKLAGLDLTECADFIKGSKEFWLCYILNHTGSPYHPTGSCPMGLVTDGDLKVKGIKKLRIVDASVMPRPPHAAPNAAVIMIAEKAADMIKNENQ